MSLADTQDHPVADTASPSEQDISKIPLTIYFLYRTLLGSVLAILFFTRTSDSILGQHNPQLFALVIF
ncbi:MAG: hypothetical protein MI754_08175, partial [Chromatiales bacterium]|nr:hypothetical protein [Chromatiales bacterium]